MEQRYEYYQEREILNPLANTTNEGISIETNCNWWKLEYSNYINESISEPSLLYIDGKLIYPSFALFDTSAGFDVFYTIAHYVLEMPICQPNVFYSNSISVKGLPNSVQGNVLLLNQDSGFAASAPQGISLSIIRGYFKKI